MPRHSHTATKVSVPRYGSTSLRSGRNISISMMPIGHHPFRATAETRSRARGLAAAVFSCVIRSRTVMPLKSIQQRIAVIGGLCLLISAGILIGYSVYLPVPPSIWCRPVSASRHRKTRCRTCNTSPANTPKRSAPSSPRRWKRRAAWQPPSRSPSRRRTADCRSAATRSTRSC